MRRAEAYGKLLGTGQEAMRRAQACGQLLGSMHARDYMSKGMLHLAFRALEQGHERKRTSRNVVQQEFPLVDQS